MSDRASHLAAAAAALMLVVAPAQPAFAQRAGGVPAATTPEAAGFSAERLKRLDAAMAKAVADGQYAGMTTLLARHGKVVAFNTYGKKSLASGEPMTKDTIFRIYSMTKPVTAVAMMILFEEGKWRLDDPVTRYVPEFADLKVATGVDAQGKPILVDLKRPPTMRELMTHTGGFAYGLGNTHPADRMFREQGVLTSNGLGEMISKVKGIPLLSQPGERWSYSVGVDVQGYIVEKLSGQTFGQFLQDRLFRPLKMTDTGFYVPPEKIGRFAALYAVNAGKLVESNGAGGLGTGVYTQPPALESGGGGLVSTTTDYARFAQMLLNGGELDGVRILSPASVELMGSNHLPAAVQALGGGLGSSRINDGAGFGLNMLVVTDPPRAGTLEGEGTMSWFGAAGTWFWVDPENDVIFVGMVQRNGGGILNAIDPPSLSRTLVYQALVDPDK